ncbi:pimeloyl-ACP methyl ester carboxylesterase [Desulfobaculum xiamenense]|uniref:Pimeloyl-ACP methyl ester carboxylesterase n=1 Tax=Desulfobaculum xiamenense TaxID=995050 RepID=A0A846QL62_9BACT|nr:alpha/beta fold hydrolase [Desulfobaculum xiamenense]NJB66923.1 pimeloyl-ACP methyl ester carboxylesterase [Desulfobaculum xiamenense]
MKTLVFLLLAALCAAIVLFACATYLIFWYETANGSDREELDRLSNGHAVAWTLRGFATALAGQCVIIATYAAGLVPRLWLPRPSDDASPHPVFLVHGLYHNPSAWLRVSRVLAREGLSRQYTFGYLSFGRNFDEVATRAKERFLKMMERHPGQRAVVVGHSLGGLVLRTFLADEDTARHIAVAVTLGTPHNGSRLASIAPGRLAKDITPDGAAIRRLNEESRPADIPCLSLSSPVDNMVLPNAALRIGVPGWEQQRTGPVSHVFMLYDRRVIRQALAFIREALAPVGTGGDKA